MIQGMCTGRLGEKDGGGSEGILVVLFDRSKWNCWSCCRKIERQSHFLESGAMCQTTRWLSGILTTKSSKLEDVEVTVNAVVHPPLLPAAEQDGMRHLFNSPLLPLCAEN